jgi:N-formylglutamate amidohydrolase
MPEIQYEEKNFVKTKKGTLPILFTCPHNGTGAPPGVSPRDDANLPAQCPKSQFSTEPDEFTSHITDGVAEKIFELTNEWPYVIKFNANRKFIDVNREKKCGCEVLEAEMIYDAYHSAIAQFTQEIRTKNSCHRLVLLFDIHGKESNTPDIIVGTRNKSTIHRW